jgi:hypothetical protein
MVLRTLLQARGNLDSSCLPSTLLSFDNDLPPVKGLERGRIRGRQEIDIWSRWYLREHNASCWYPRFFRPCFENDYVSRLFKICQVIDWAHRKNLGRRSSKKSKTGRTDKELFESDEIRVQLRPKANHNDYPRKSRPIDSNLSVELEDPVREIRTRKESECSVFKRTRTTWLWRPLGWSNKMPAAIWNLKVE